MKRALFFLCLCLSFLGFNGCDYTDLHEQRTAVLDALFHHILDNDSTRVAKSSYPYDQDNMMGSWDTLHLSQIEAINQGLSSDPSDSLTFTEEDINTFNRQLATNPKAVWPQWGWKTPHFIAEEEYPDYFSKGPTIPPVNPSSTPRIEIMSISVPLVSSDRAFVAVLVNKGYRSMALNVYLLGKVNDQWIIIAARNVSIT